MMTENAKKNKSLYLLFGKTQTLLSSNVVTFELNWYESYKKQNNGWNERLVEFKEHFLLKRINSKTGAI